MNRRSVLISLAGHAGLILLLLVVQGFSGESMPLGGGDAVWVEVVTLSEPGSTARVETPPVDDIVPEDAVQETVDTVTPEDLTTVDDPVENPVEEPVEDGGQDPVQDAVQEPVQQDDASSGPPGGYVSVDAQGEAGGGAPGPATYEGRVFSAIRRNFRTASEPEQSYRIEVTVRPDGSLDVETLRTSGVDLFDRAVQHALAMAQIPPFPPGRTSPAVLRIEFLGLVENQ